MSHPCRWMRRLPRGWPGPAGSVRQAAGDVTEGQLADVTCVSRQDGHSRRAAPLPHCAARGRHPGDGTDAGVTTALSRMCQAVLRWPVLPIHA
jgi:hypothetical protein